MERSKRVLLFSTAYYPFVGGAEVAVKEITDRIPNMEFDLITARFDSKLPTEEKIGRINVFRLGFGIPTLDKLLLPFWGAIKTFELNAKNNYDYFWCIMATFASGAAYIYNILHFWKTVPIILNLQEGDSEEHFKTHWFGLVDLSWKLALWRTRYLTVLSRFLKDRAERLGYSGKVWIIPNGVDVDGFKSKSDSLTPEERNDIRSKWGIKTNDVALITTSRLVRKNGVGDVIEALPKLSANVKFVICGVGELRQELEDKARQLGVGDRVIFLGNVSRNDLPKYLKACDIFIRPSLSEGFGVSFMEAMATKIPVIATPVGGIVDFLVDPTSQELRGAGVQTGYLCRPEDPESVATTVKKVIGDKERSKIIVEEAFKMIREKYDWEIVTRQMKDVFDYLTTKK